MSKPIMHKIWIFSGFSDETACGLWLDIARNKTITHEKYVTCKNCLRVLKARKASN